MTAIRYLIPVVLLPLLVAMGRGVALWARAVEPPRQLIASYNDEHSATLRWEVVPGARYYRLQISEQRDFTTLRTDALVLQGKNWNRATVAGLERGKSYWWRVQAVGAEGESAWSIPVRLRLGGEIVETPSGLLPPNQSTVAVGSLRLSWQPCVGATAYRVQISSHPQFISDLVQLDCLEPSVTVATLKAGVRYYWRVQANRGSESSMWSVVQSFQVAALNVASAEEISSSSFSPASEQTAPALKIIGAEDVPFTFVSNPVADQVTIRSNQTVSGTITLFDLRGRRVFEQVAENIRELTLSVSNLPVGSYTLVFNGREHQWYGTVDILR